MNREDFNKQHPVTGDYTACQQGKDFVAAHPATPPGEIPVPIISTKGNLTHDEAVAELQELTDMESPKYGWASWLGLRIEQRKTDLCKSIAYRFLRN